MPNLINPQTLNEKILLKMLFDRNPKLTLFADKFLVRDFVKSRLEDTEQHLTKLYAVVDTLDKIHSLNLPNQFVMKVNHLSGGVKIVRDFKGLECGELERFAEVHLNENWHRSHQEWCYKNIKPCIIFEELLDFEGNLPDDYKFFCFNGNPQFIQIDRGRFIKHQRNIYDLSLSLLPVRFCYENFQDKVSVPKNFDKMIEIAKRLSKGTDFIRVDLYNINGRIIFGELTNYPEAGLGKFDPSFWDKEFGSYWNR
ncbi:MAG: ATP-grasp fold amidoligase family protein [Candidatus Omnitrophica bacterium]|nr:ATP-grasp fold amidoligase family protein [Candidatus Omnitrophota bacterium]